VGTSDLPAYVVCELAAPLSRFVAELFSTRLCASVRPRPTGRLWRTSTGRAPSRGAMFLLLLIIVHLCRPAFTQGVTVEVNAIGSMDDAIKNGVGERGITDHFMPPVDRT
jgi:hypothetical protein